MQSNSENPCSIGRETDDPRDPPRPPFHDGGYFRLHGYV